MFDVIFSLNIIINRLTQLFRLALFTHKTLTAGWEWFRSTHCLLQRPDEPRTLLGVENQIIGL